MPDFGVVPAAGLNEVSILFWPDGLARIAWTVSLSPHYPLLELEQDL